MATTCPVCEAVIDIDEDEIDEGDNLTCDECGADLRVATVDPLELESLDDDEDDDEEPADFDEDDEEDEEEEEEGEDWK